MQYRNEIRNYVRYSVYVIFPFTATGQARSLHTGQMGGEKGRQKAKGNLLSLRFTAGDFSPFCGRCFWWNRAKMKGSVAEWMW